MSDELKIECEETNRLLSRLREFIKDIDRLPDKEAFSISKNLREEVGEFLENMNFINLIDRPFLMYVGYPRFLHSLKDLGISEMELLLINIKNFCDGKNLSLEESLRLVNKI